MSTAEKLGMGIITIGLITTLVLPDRKTAQVIDAFARLFRGALGTAITGKV